MIEACVCNGPAWSQIVALAVAVALTSAGSALLASAVVVRFLVRKDLAKAGDWRS